MAEADTLLYLQNGLRQLGCLFLGNPQQVEGHALRGLGSDAGQLLQLAHQAGQRLCVVDHPPSLFTASFAKLLLGSILRISRYCASAGWGFPVFS